MAIMTDVDKQIAELRLGNDSGGNRDCDWRMKLRAANTIQSLKDENERLKAVLMTESEKRDLLSKEHYRTRIAELEAQVESQGDWIRIANRVMSKQRNPHN